LGKIITSAVLYFSDEMRYGMMSNFRRSWSKVGDRSVLPQKQGFTNGYLFTAINPLTGESFHLLGFDDMSTETEYIFLTELKKKHPHKHIVVVIDNAPCHKPKILHSIDGLTLVYLPPYSPELNPVERFFEEMRRATANTLFTTLNDIEERLSTAINLWTEGRVKQLCCYDWIERQLGEVS
jgi:transposase